MNGPFSLMGGAALLVSGVVSTLGGVGLYEVASNVLSPITVPITVETLDVYDYRATAGGVKYQPVAQGYGKDDPLRAVWEGWVVRISDQTGTEKVCEGDGLGRYTDLSEPVDWTLDYTVGDNGCSDRLAPGKYELVVRLTPLDARGVVRRTAEFTVRGQTQ